MSSYPTQYQSGRVHSMHQTTVTTETDDEHFTR